MFVAGEYIIKINAEIEKNLIGIPCSVVAHVNGDSRVCFGCHQLKDTQLKRCTKCHGATYCSAQCQKLHWNEHKQYCVHNPIKGGMILKGFEGLHYFSREFSHWRPIKRLSSPFTTFFTGEDEKSKSTDDAIDITPYFAHFTKITQSSSKERKQLLIGFVLFETKDAFCVKGQESTMVLWKTGKITDLGIMDEEPTYRKVFEKYFVNAPGVNQDQSWEKNKEQECPVCMEHTPLIAVPCWHIMCCDECAHKMVDVTFNKAGEAIRNYTCVVCRKKVEECHQLFILGK